MRLTPAETQLQRMRIIESAKNEFILRGYAATKMEDIAKGAGISRSPLYYHFTNKQELFNEVFIECCRKMEIFEEEVYASNDSVFGCLYRGLFGSIYMLDDNVESLRGNLLRHGEELVKSQKRYDILRARIREIKSNKFRDSIAKGELRPDCDVELLCDMSFLFCRGVVTELRIVGDEAWDKAHISKLVKQFVGMVRDHFGVKA